MAKEEIAALGASLPADPMFPMFGKSLEQTTRAVLDRKLTSAAAFSKVVTDRRAKNTALQKSFDKIRRARADKHTELGEDGLKLGAAAALLARVEAALASYDAAKDAEESGGDRRLAMQIRIAKLARELSTVLGLPGLDRLATAFLGNRPILAIVGDWTETKANSIDHLRADI